MIAAGNAKFTTAGTNNEKKSLNGTTPLCQTNNVVISPNGLKDPPALVATTTLTAATVTN